MMQTNPIELLAPAGNFESLMAAIQGGANAIYFGVEQLNMRARASVNFCLNDIETVANLCQQQGVRSYLTLNTIVYDHDLAIAKKMMDRAKRAGINAVIAADVAVIGYAHSIGLSVHISTQCNISNIETVRFYAPFADVMVLARELSLRQMTAICAAIQKEQIKGPSGNLVQIEVFAHGALCMAVSGKCYISLHTHNASANRGACIQNCRHQYKVTDVEEGTELAIDNEYIMSAKDLCTLPFLDELLQTGVSVLKIEGRGKEALYVNTVTRVYAQAIASYKAGKFDSEQVATWMQQLQSVYNRGFWSGYYLGQKVGEWANTAGSIATTKKLYLGKGHHYYPKNKIAEFAIEAYPLQVGDRVLITGPITGVVETTIQSLHVNNEGAQPIAQKGDLCAFPVTVPIRKQDKLYKLMNQNVLEG